MSDTEEPVAIFEEVVEDKPIEEVAVVEDVAVKGKPKKAKKEISPERREQLRQNLIKGRATSLANRKKKAEAKGTFKKVKTIEEEESEERALDIAKARIADAESKKEQRETAKTARAEAKEAKSLALELRKELDELKSERAASKARKAAIKADADAAAKKHAEEVATIEANKPKKPVVKPTPTGRDLIRLMRGL